MRYALLSAHCATAATAVLTVAAAATAQPTGHGAWVDRGDFGTFHVVIPENPAPELERAATTFIDLWRIATGHTIAASAQNEGKINVWLGREAAPEDLVSRRDTDRLVAHEFLIRTYKPTRRYRSTEVSDHLLIIGGSDHATLDGVYEFFFRYMNLRWFMPGEPTRNTTPIFLTEIDIEVSPPFAERRMALGAADAEARDRFAAAMRLTAAAPPAHNAGGAVTPPDFPAERKPGIPYAAGPLCPCAPRAAEVVAMELLKALDPGDEIEDKATARRRSRLGWTPEKRDWCIEHMDWIPFEICADCAALNEERGSPAATWLELANGVAARLQDSDAGAGHRIQIFAQRDRQTPPRGMEVHPNVDVWIDTSACDLRAPIGPDGPSANAAFARDLDAWAALTPNVYVWDYLADATNPEALFPVFHVIQPNLRFYDQHNVRGVYYAGLGDRPGEPPLHGLRRFLGARLLWDPDYPMEEAIDGYCNAAYGAAAPNVRALIDGMERSAQLGEWKVGPGAPEPAAGHPVYRRLRDAFGEPALEGAPPEVIDRIEALRRWLTSRTAKNKPPS